MPTPPTHDDLIRILREKNPSLKDLSDTEIEAFVGAKDPRYRDLFDRLRGALPAAGPGKIPSPTDYEDNSLGTRLKESAVKTIGDQIDTDVDALPMAGGIVGGIVGGVGGAAGGFGVGGVPGAMAGAGVGGATGETIKQFVNRARGREGPRDWSDRATDVAKEGAINAAFEGAGGLVAKGLKASGEAAYKLGAHMPAGLVREFPTAVRDAIAARIPITAKGAERASAEVAARGAEADAAIQAAQDAGAKPLDLVDDILNPVQAQVGPKAEAQAGLGRPQGQADLGSRMDKVKDWFRRGPVPPTPPPTPVREMSPAYEAMLEQQRQLGPQANLLPNRVFMPTANEVKAGAELGPQAMLAPRRMISGPAPVEAAAEAVAPKLFNDVPLTQAQTLKREAQDLANKAFRAQERGAEINSVQTATDQAMAKALRQGIESRVPEVAGINEAAQRAMGVDQMIESARARPNGFGMTVLSGLIGSQGVPMLFHDPLQGLATMGTGAILKGLTTPQALSHGAILADRAAVPALQANAYRAVAEALRRALADEEQQPSP